jgi:gas vesicle protein
MSNDGGSDFIKGLLVGGAIGAVVALLYAPKSGKETREELAKKKDELYDKVKDEYSTTLANAKKSIAAAHQKLEELGKVTQAKAEEISEYVEKSVDQSKKNITEQKSRLKEAAHAAKEVYKEEKSKKKRSS